MEGFDFDRVVERVAELVEVSADEVLSGGRKRQTVTARRLLCFWAASELGLSQAWLARRLRISQPAVSVAVDRGRKLVAEKLYTLT
jgi:chromosomal replication initiation ATPase DnaA